MVFTLLAKMLATATMSGVNSIEVCGCTCLDYLGQHNTQTAHWHSLPALFWLNSYVTSQHIAAAPQSGEKDQFYCSV
jgi:hypothetical protein